jgi:hypothetical protein
MPTGTPPVDDDALPTGTPVDDDDGIETGVDEPTTAVAEEEAPTTVEPVEEVALEMGGMMVAEEEDAVVLVTGGMMVEEEESVAFPIGMTVEVEEATVEFVEEPAEEETVPLLGTPGRLEEERVTLGKVGAEEEGREWAEEEEGRGGAVDGAEDEAEGTEEAGEEEKRGLLAVEED